MYAEITLALSSIKSLIDIAKITNDVKTSSEVLKQTIELQSVIITLQEKMTLLQSEKAALIQDKQNLEQKIAELNQWSSDAAQYELKEIAAGVFVYAVAPSATITKPAHWLCAHCYQDRRPSILLRAEKAANGTTYFCPQCKTEIIDHSDCLFIPTPYAVGGRRRAAT